MAPVSSVLLIGLVAAGGRVAAVNPTACESTSSGGSCAASEGQDLSSLLQRPSSAEAAEEQQHSTRSSALGGEKASAAQLGADIDPGYSAQAAVVVTSGSPGGSMCPYPIDSVSACNAAALSTPEVANVGAQTQSASDRPYGCWWQPSNGMLFFNSQVTSVGCTQGWQCVCQRPQTAPPPPAYSEKKFGFCSPAISSASECQAALLALGAIPNNVRVQTQSASDRPYGCWWQPQNDMAFFNSDSSSTVACSDDRPCVCASASPSPYN